MSIMLVGPSGALGTELVRRLVSEGDEVRVVQDDRGRDEGWRSLGAHVARGSVVDEDLLERAGQNVRTVMMFEPTMDGAVAAITAARKAGIGRAVVWAARMNERIVQELRASGLDFVCLSGAKSGPFRRSPDPRAIAEAIDAADDLAGEPRLVLELGDSESWAKLGLQTPK